MSNELLQTMDATKWAKEFIRIFGDKKQDIDYDLMHSWFAAAIMTGWDHSNWNDNRRLKRSDLLQAFGLTYTLPKHSHKVLDSEVGIDLANIIFKKPWENIEDPWDTV